MSDFPPDKIAELRARFAAKPDAAPGRTKSREEREVRARTYGDGRRRKRKKKAPSTRFVQLNNKVEPEFKELVQTLADELGYEYQVEAIRHAVYLLEEHLPRILAERAAKKAKELT